MAAKVEVQHQHCILSLAGPAWAVRLTSALLMPGWQHDATEHQREQTSLAGPAWADVLAGALSVLCCTIRPKLATAVCAGMKRPARGTESHAALQLPQAVTEHLIGPLLHGGTQSPASQPPHLPDTT